MSLHTFDPKIAASVGVNASVIYQNILFWTEKNEANGRHIYDGHVWTYNSIKALTSLFPYLSASQIRTAIQKLIDADLIAEGNYNIAGYDRTKWYGVKSQMHLLEIANGIAKNRKPIPNVNTDIKPDKIYIDHFDDFWERYPRKAGKAAAQKAFAKAAKKHGADQIMFGLSQHLPALEKTEPQFRPHAATWLNGERYNDEPEQPTSGRASPNGGGYGGTGSGGGVGSGTANAFIAAAQKRGHDPNRGGPDDL
jgi:hypothetical protein